jgi:hypothetical protein
LSDKDKLCITKDENRERVLRNWVRETTRFFQRNVSSKGDPEEEQEYPGCKGGKTPLSSELLACVKPSSKSEHNAAF